jgi:hypothetical protein
VCEKWSIQELAVLPEEGGRDGNIPLEVLIAIRPGATTSYWDWPEISDQLAAIFQRKIHLIATGGIKQLDEGKAILNSREILYAAPAR